LEDHIVQRTLISVVAQHRVAAGFAFGESPFLCVTWSAFDRMNT
jgi:hypothetical protein